jgi:REP-associated tyrosine transposase
MASLLLDTLLHYRREQKYLLHEYVVMPNHLHLIFTPADITLERAMQFVKGGFSYRAKKEVRNAVRNLGTRLCGSSHSRCG